jgi:hypothetical protein
MEYTFLTLKFNFPGIYPTVIYKLVNDSFDLTCTLNTNVMNGNSSNMSFFIGNKKMSENLISVSFKFT